VRLIRVGDLHQIIVLRDAHDDIAFVRRERIASPQQVKGRRQQPPIGLLPVIITKLEYLILNHLFRSSFADLRLLPISDALRYLVTGLYADSASAVR
jgi:hypothetical protein